MPKTGMMKHCRLFNKLWKTIGINKLKRAIVQVGFPHLAKSEPSTLWNQSMIIIIVSFLDPRHYMPTLGDGRKNYNDTFMTCLVM